ncbi:hypothetical protein HYW74_04895 [Candidatus Pacearchaeota archaeon]|nr:hypothetical protein [Candidatus Pacearchaeota archaeon]
MANSLLKNRKGDFTIGQIAAIILLLVGFVLLLFIYYQLNWTGEVDRSVCHQSVIFRGTLPSEAKEVVSLKCPTAKICITGEVFKKGNCDEFKNEEGVITVRVSNSENGLDQIQQAYSQEVLGCWSMMGEGKVSLYSQFLADKFAFKTVYPSCVICSRIAIDEESLNKVPFDKMNLFSYMTTHIPKGKDKTYFDIMSGDKYSADFSLGDSLNINSFKLGDENIESISGQLEQSPNEKILKETAVLFMQISDTPTYTGVLVNDLVGAGVVNYGFRAITPKIIRTGIKKVVGGWVGVALAVIGVGAQEISVAHNRAVSASYCGDMSLGDKSRSGCSVVRTADYNAEGIFEYCQNIESIS